MTDPGRFHPFWRQSRFQLAMTGLLVLMWLIFLAASPRTFLSPRIYVSFMSTIPFTSVLALGLTLLIVAGEMDLSFPSVMAMSGLAFGVVFKATGMAWPAVIAALAVGGTIGLLNGLLVVKIGVPSIIATIGAQFLWRGAATLLSDGLAVNLVAVRQTLTHHLLVGRINGFLPAQALWAVGLAVILWLLLNRRPFGDNVLFIGDNIQTARMMGIPVDRTRILLFGLMGLCAALASLMVCMEMANWWPTHGDGYLLLVFASIFVGGTSVFGGQGTIYGTMIGSVIIGIIEAGIISAGLSGFWTRFIYGLIIIASVSAYAWLMKTRKE